MKEYHSKQIRNVALLGHLGTGKTSLAESLLFVSGAIKAKGEVERKNTVGDYTVEEQNRQTTLTASLIPVEYNGYKINFIDTPGSEEFIGEIENVLSVVEGAVLLVDASSGVQVGTERCWDELRARKIPTLILINKTDKENVKMDAVLAEINEELSSHAKEVSAPFSEELMEIAAESDEELLNKYLEELELSEEDTVKGLRNATLNCDFFPIVTASAIKNEGVKELMDKVIDVLPSPCSVAPIKGVDASGKEVERKPDDNAPFSARVFKTISDPFVGSINFLKVYSGSVRVAQEALLANTGEALKMSQLFSMMGKTQIPVDAAFAGDIVAVAKMANLFTGCTVCDKKDVVTFKKEEHPTPTIYVAINPKNKQDEEKISTALQKLSVEDETFEIKRNAETSQTLIGGQGMTHIGYILEKMKNMYKVDVDLADPKIVYRETIRSKGEAQGRHKKQSGGAGQFGDVWIRFEPTDKDFEFCEEIFGGSVPKNYFPAVEKGLIKVLEHGPLAGFPVIKVKATLYDGSYHPVDSNEISFVIAAGLAFKNAVDKLRPTILEPIMEVEVIAKSEYFGAIMGDMTKRRGRILSTEELEGGKSKIVAEVPEAEIIKYTTDLKAMTQASGRFSRKFVRYEEVPEMLIKKICDEYKQAQ